MAGKVRFYRGAQGASLPATRQDGAIFIVERTGTDELGYNLGDMYVDMDNGKRLHIIPDGELIIYKSSMSGTTSTLGQVYVFQESNKNGIAVGDGKAYIGDLPVYGCDFHEKIATAFKNKVNAYLGTEYLVQNQLNKDKGSVTNKPLSDNFPKKIVNDTEVIDNQALEETLVLSREL